MWDIGCTAAILVFFWIAALYVNGCARLSTDSTDGRHGADPSAAGGSHG